MQETTTHTNESGISTVSCFLLGVAIGSAGALLLAPEPGRKLRRRIAHKVADGRKHVENHVKQSWDKANDLAKEAGQLLDTGRRHLSEEGRRLEVAIQAGRDAYRNASTQETAL
jgi:gas vesicle protein